MTIVGSFPKRTTKVMECTEIFRRSRFAGSLTPLLLRMFWDSNPGIPRHPLLEDRTTEIVPAASAGDMSKLRQLWPQSLFSEMSRLTWRRSVGSVSAGLVAYDQAHVLIVGGTSPA